MTPAEKPRLAESNFVFVFLVKIARALPIPVDNPAKTVNPNANQKCSVFIWLKSLFFIRQNQFISQKSTTAIAVYTRLKKCHTPVRDWSADFYYCASFWRIGVFIQ